MIFFGLQELIEQALAEDIGPGDITTMNLVPPGVAARGEFRSKAAGVVAGLDICRAVFQRLDPQAVFTPGKQDGDPIVPGDLLAEVQGETRALLTGERVALNFLQRLSGIATKTRHMSELIADQKAQLVDTRKTTPGLRYLEKYAVKAGGGRNHRIGLFDGVMIKDNHIQAAGGIKQAVVTVREKVPHTLKIEVEVENLAQLEEALQAGADIILLDNMDLATMKEAVRIVNGRALLEASGGINEATIVDVAGTGVDFISCGALTHSATSLDISFYLK